MLYCIYCGTPLEDGDLFCTGCGQPVANTENIHMMPGREPVRQGSLDPTNPDIRPERSAGAGGLYYGENGGSGGMGSGDDPGPGKNRIAIIIAGVAFAVIICAFFLLLTGGFFKKDKDTKEEETVAYQEPGSDEEESVSGPDGSGQEAEDGEIPDDGEASGQPEEEAPAAEPAEQEAAPASEEPVDEEKDGTGAAPAGSQSGTPAEQSDLSQAAETPLDQQKSDTAAQENAAAKKQAAEEQNKKNPSGRENMSGVDSTEKLKEEPVAASGDSSYILADSDKRTYSREELSRLDDYTLQMAINELYARHGRKFKTPEIQEYFDGKSWYDGTISPEEFDGNEAAYFNNYEMKNRELMAKIRDERAAAGSQR